MKEWESFVPSNQDPRSGSIHPHEELWREICKGGELKAKDVIPILMFSLGYPMYKRPPKVVESTDGENLDPEAEEEKKKQEAAKKKKAAKKDDKKNANVNPEDLPPEDWYLNEVGVQPLEDGSKR